jgi:type IV secretion system protein TrbB
MLTLSASQQRLCEKLCSDFGKEILNFLLDEDIYEIMVNPNGEVWVDSEKNGQIHAGELSVSQALAILNSVAGIHGLIISSSQPRLEAELPFFSVMQGQRLTGIVPPVVSAPCFTIRKRCGHALTLDDYVQSSRLTDSQADALRRLIQARKNILVCGGPGSGKTTLVNALIQDVIKINPQHRLVLLEDLPELQCHAHNSVSLLTSEHANLRDLLHTAMRLRPDRILIGEVRGAEALEMLKAWNTGCPGGICTIHANNPEAAIQRLVDLTLEAGLMQPPWSLLEQTLNAIVIINRRADQKGCVEKIVHLTGRIHEDFILETLA